MGKITEGSLEWYRTVLNQIISSDMTIYQNQKDCLDLLLNMNIDLPFNENQEARKMAMKVSQYSHNIAEKCAALTGSGNFDDIYWQYLLLEAPHLFESYLLYMEKNRPDSKKFYIPRKKTLHVVAKDLQDLEERKIEKADANAAEAQDGEEAPKRERKARAGAKKAVTKEDQDAINAAVASKFAKDSEE